MAYEPRVAAALSGATVRQLSYWRRTRALVPETSASRPVLYSFRDLVALRTFAYLRGDRSLQSIRKAVRTLKDIGETEHLSSYRLVAQGKRSIALVQDEGAVDLVEKPGQSLTVVKLGDVLQSFPVGDIQVPDLLHPRERISVDPEIRGGHPVVEGTRVPFEVVADLVRDGVEPEQVAAFYPSVSADAARDAADFADYVDRSAGRRAA
ncbi:DUF433 domain-containing protein [Plantactinospora sp. KBS50]|uniref:DUF433 domain-containing protein n=1 Tax=Plantactinospora sp. KBS50 TaxID=2024580 RepID=UPI000BAAB96A|nr:DUF433 domain-containing protein [Plantactinospora sp. KBS50]ASW56033.1 hypothetical protein CIK06_20410 [Plantactinospora sp. KBS50]